MRTSLLPACSYVLDLDRRHLAAVDERIRQLRRFGEQLAGEISKWDGDRQPTCAGLCRIIVDSSISGAEQDPTNARFRGSSSEVRRR